MTQRAGLAEQLPALFEQIGEDIRSLTTVITGNGRPDMPETTDGKITGNEPNGVVYYSLDGANVGAWQWTKINGKWKCTHGDTEWREVKSAELSKGSVFFRRVGNTVYVSLGGGDYDTVTFANVASHYSNKRALCSVPKGFRTAKSTLTTLTDDGKTVVGMVVITSISDANAVLVRNVSSSAKLNLARMPIVSYPTEEDFPVG